MILRFKKTKPGQQQQQQQQVAVKRNLNKKAVSTTPTPTPRPMPPKKKKKKTTKKKKNTTKKKKKKKIDEIDDDDSHIPEDVINILLDRFFSPREGLGAHKQNPNVEEEESDYVEESDYEEECSTRGKRKKPEGKRTGNVKRGNSSKKPNKGKETEMSNMFSERDVVADPPLQPRQIEEHGLFPIYNEEEPEIVTLYSGVMSPEHNYQANVQTWNTTVLKPSSTNSSKRRKGRGITTLPHITEDVNCVRKVVEYNKNGQPVGSVGQEFSSYLGVLGRKMVPITYESWHKVPKELKMILLNHVEDKYIIDSKRRKTAISSIGERWRSFKANLTRFFVTPFKDQPELLSCPPQHYNFIKQEQWDAFVKSRLSEEFQAKSKLQAERRAKNLYNHRLSRRGYAGLIEDLKQSLGTSVDELDRCVLWKKARQNKEGLYVNDAVREKAELIDELMKQKEAGNLIIQRGKDILTLALGTPEHTDRVRGVGHCVTPTAYFNLPKRNSKKYVGDLEQKVNQQADEILEMNQMVQELRTHCDGISQQGTPTIPSSEKISSSDSRKHLTIPSVENRLCGSQYESGFPNDDHSLHFEYDSRKHLTTPSVENRSCGSQDESGFPNDDHSLHFEFETDYQATDNGNTKFDMSPADVNPGIGKSKQCRLAVGSTTNVEAGGMVFERVGSNEKIHNAPLGESNVRVAVEYAISPNGVLPVPLIGEMTIVKDVIGSCVAWPKEFVIGVEEEEKQADVEKSGPIQAFASFIDQMMSTNNITIPMQNVLFEERVEAHLQKADLMYLCNMQEIASSCIITYIRFLFDNLISYQETYRFVHPASISSARGPSASSIITKRLQTAKKDQLYFVPYNTRGHWILIIIDSSSMDVYWLDPLQKPPSMDVKIYVTTGLKALQTDGKKRPSPTWHSIKCPKPSFDVQCGYYVMRYMRELMEESSRPFAEKILQLSKNITYSQDDVDEVRLELIDFILTYM